MESERFVTVQATYQLARMVLGWALINMKNSRPLPFGSRGATFWNYTQGGELTADSCVHSMYTAGVSDGGATVTGLYPPYVGDYRPVSRLGGRLGGVSAVLPAGDPFGCAALPASETRGSGWGEA